MDLFLALIELFNAGLINKPSDCWTYSEYVYKKINAECRANKKSLTLAEHNEVTENNSDTTMFYDKAFGNVEKMECYKKIEQFIYNQLDKRCNKDNIVKAFINCSC